MHALSRTLPTTLEPCAEVVSFAELNRARSRRVLERDDPRPAEPHPWAYGFPRPGPAGRRG